MAAPVVAVLCIFAAVASSSRGYGNLADTSVTCFVSLPGFLLLADWTVATHTRAEQLDNPFFHAFVGSLASITYYQGTFALQVLILAGCHPVCCGLAGILMTTLGLSALPPLIDSPLGVTFDPWCVCCILYVILPTSHALDRFRRRQAITDDEMDLELADLA